MEGCTVIRYSMNMCEYCDIRDSIHNEWPDYETFLYLDTVPESIQPYIDRDPKFHTSLKDSLKFKFKHIESIRQCYSQSWQDFFVLTVLDGKIHGTWLELGAGCPNAQTNTYLLENVFHWSGISVDIENFPYCDYTSIRPKADYVIADATTLDYSTLLKNMPAVIDYLQVDIDQEWVPTFIQSQEFSVITHETDVGFGKDPNPSREFYQDHGYLLLVKNVAVRDSSTDSWHAFEDWYVNPRTVSFDIIQCLQDTSDEPKPPHTVFVK